MINAINLSYKKFKTFTVHRKARIRQDLILPSENLVKTVTVCPVAVANNGNNYVLAVEFDNYEYPDATKKTVEEVFPNFTFSHVEGFPNMRLYIPELKFGLLMLVSWKLWEEMVNAGLNERISAVGVSISKVLEKLHVPVLLEIGKIIAASDFAVMYYKNKQHPAFYHNKESLIKAVQKAYNKNCSIDRKAQVIDLLESKRLLQPIREEIKKKEEHERQKQLLVVKRKVKNLTQKQGLSKTDIQKKEDMAKRKGNVVWNEDSKPTINKPVTEDATNLDYWL